MFDLRSSLTIEKQMKWSVVLIAPKSPYWKRARSLFTYVRYKCQSCDVAHMLNTTDAEKTKTQNCMCVPETDIACP